MRLGACHCISKLVRPQFWNASDSYCISYTVKLLAGLNISSKLVNLIQKGAYSRTVSTQTVDAL